MKFSLKSCNVFCVGAGVTLTADNETVCSVAVVVQLFSGMLARYLCAECARGEVDTCKLFLRVSWQLVFIISADV